MISMMFVGFKGVFLVSVEVFLGFLLVPKVGVLLGSNGVFWGWSPLVFLLGFHWCFVCLR